MYPSSFNRSIFTKQAQEEMLSLLRVLATWKPTVDYSCNRRQDSPKRWTPGSNGNLGYHRFPHSGYGKPREYRTGPTHREVMAATGIRCPYTSSLRKAQLAALGLVTYIPNRSRSLAITEKGRQFLDNVPNYDKQDIATPNLVS